MGSEVCSGHKKMPQFNFFLLLQYHIRSQESTFELKQYNINACDNNNSLDVSMPLGKQFLQWYHMDKFVGCSGRLTYNHSISSQPADSVR